MQQSSSIENQRSLYKKIIIDYFRKNNGHFMVYSKDELFVKTLRQVAKDLSLAIDNLFTFVQHDYEILKIIKVLSEHGKRIVLFVELDENKGMEFILKQVKFAYPTIYIVTLITLKQKEKSKGADYCDNTIVRPISKESLLEKIVFTIKPQANFGKLIDAGRILLSQKDYTKAQQAAQIILGKKPGSMAGLLLLGDIYREQGFWDQAEAEYLKAHNFVPFSLEPLIALAAIAKQQNNKAKLDDYMKKAVALSSVEEMRFLEEQGFSLDFIAPQQENEAELKEIYAELARLVIKAIPLFPNDKIDSAITFINCYLKAKENFIVKEDAYLYEKVAQFYLTLNKNREALRAYQCSILLLPDRADTYYRFVALSDLENLTDQAYLGAKKLLQLSPRYGHDSLEKAEVLYRIFQKAGDRKKEQYWAEIVAELKKQDKKDFKYTQTQ